MIVLVLSLGQLGDNVTDRNLFMEVTRNEGEGPMMGSVNQGQQSDWQTSFIYTTGKM